MLKIMTERPELTELLCPMHGHFSIEAATMSTAMSSTSGTIRTVIKLKPKFFAFFVVVLVAMAASAPTLAQLNSERVQSDLSLVIDSGSEVSVMPVIAETSTSTLMTYNLSGSEVQLSAGVVAPDYSDPLFCFDLGSPSATVSLQATDPNGHAIIDDFYLSSSLKYFLGSPSLVLDASPADSQQCFFLSDQDVFGLFGQASEASSEPPGTIMRSRFEAELSVGLEFVDVPEYVTLGEPVSYKLVVTNTGDADLNQVALQELFPENRGVYAAALHSTSWTCTPTGDAVCPVLTGSAPLRFNDFNSGGVDITVGDSLTFAIQRTVDNTSLTGQSIQLHAGVVADPAATGTPFAVDQALMTVIGESAGLNVSATGAVADGNDSSTITVTVLDANQNPVPGETVTFDGVSPAESLNVTPASGVSDENGQVVFDSGPTTNAGDYTVDFSAGTLTGSGTVTFDHGPAANWYVYPVKTEAVADGSDAVILDVEVEDANGNPVDSVAVDVTNNGGLGSISNQEFTDVDGMATFTATSTSTGVFEIEFSTDLGTKQQTLEFIAGEPDDLEFTQQPSNVVGDSETTMSPAPALRVIDVNSNLVAHDSTTQVTLNLLDSNGIQVSGYAGFEQGQVTNGEISFPEITFPSSLQGTGYKIEAIGSNNGEFFGVTSTSFDITAP